MHLLPASISSTAGFLFLFSYFRESCPPFILLHEDGKNLLLTALSSNWAGYSQMNVLYLWPEVQKLPGTWIVDAVCPQDKRDVELLEWFQRRPQRCLEGWSTYSMKTGRDCWAFWALGKRRLWGDLNCGLPVLWIGVLIRTVMTELHRACCNWTRGNGFKLEE